MEESQSKPCRSRRLTSQLSLSPESKLFYTNRTHLISSKSLGLVGTSVPTPSETSVTLNIYGIPAFVEEVSQPPEDSRIDPSVKVNTSIPEPAPSAADSEGVIPQTSVVTESIPSSAPKIFYEPDGLPLPPGLIAIEEIVEDPPSSTPSHFGVGITLYPSSSEISLPLSEVPVESLGNLLDRLDMSEQPSTSRTMSSDTEAIELSAITPTMFTSVPSVTNSSQSLEGIHPGVASTVWFVPICSSAIISGISYVESQQIDASQCQFGQSNSQRQIIPLSTELPPYGGQYALSLSPPGEQTYESSQQNSGYARITSSGWMPILPQQPRVVYSMQQSLPMSNIPTTPAIVTVLQVQALPIVCQPQVSQVTIQQPLVPTTPPQSSISGSLTGVTQVQMGTITPHLG